MRRLYLQFYLTILASLLMVVLVASALWRFAPTEAPSDRAFEMAGVLVADQLAPIAADANAQQHAIDRLHAPAAVGLAADAVEHRPAALEERLGETTGDDCRGAGAQLSHRCGDRIAAPGAVSRRYFARISDGG